MISLPDVGVNASFSPVLAPAATLGDAAGSLHPWSGFFFLPVAGKTPMEVKPNSYFPSFPLPCNPTGIFSACFHISEVGNEAMASIVSNETSDSGKPSPSRPRRRAPRACQFCRLRKVCSVRRPPGKGASLPLISEQCCNLWAVEMR
jgi:hypothetical protein